MIRIGHGYDVHKLVEGRNLIIGGVEIPHNRGLLGHSDADVLTHAVMDAILGAMGLNDIGVLFPSNEKYKDANSMNLLQEVINELKKRSYEIGNIDTTIIAQKPKMREYVEEMKMNLARICEISREQINIKATTEEGLGFTGREEGIAAHAVVVICN